MKIRPLHDYVIIKRVEEQETVRGGIIIPDSAKEKQQEGEVVAVGAGKRLENGTLFQSKSRLATAFFLASIRDLKSNWKAKSFSWSTKVRSWELLPAPPLRQKRSRRREIDGS